MLNVDNISLYYGAAQALRGVSIAAEPGKVFSRDDILNRLRGHEADLYTRAVDIVVSRLRRKLEQDPSDPKIIKTVWGGGYIFTPTVGQE